MNKSNLLENCTWSCKKFLATYYFYNRREHTMYTFFNKNSPTSMIFLFHFIFILTQFVNLKYLYFLSSAVESIKILLASMRVSWKVYRLKSSWPIGSLQHWWKNCMDHKEDYIVKLIWLHSMQVSWSASELFGQPLFRNYSK